MSTPEQLASLEGQQYLVLRPTSAVADLYVDEQRKALGLSALPHPNTGHVTLRGFYEPSRPDELREVVRRWAADQGPIEIVAEAVDSFAAPWQIVILRLARTPSLVSAYATLTQRLAGSDFVRLGELGLDDWTFHMSVVYGKALAVEAWEDVEARCVRDLPQPPRETVRELELVFYGDGEERSELIPLGS